MSVKGITLVQGQAVVLELDGTLVYVEAVEPMFASVVALPEQPAPSSSQRVFTPGCVGAKKISPFAQPSSVVALDALSPRNQAFIVNFPALRELHGKTHVDRTPEEQAAIDAAANPPPKKAREPKKASPRYLKRCTVCNEQPAHPNHEVNNGGHEFAEPAGQSAKAAKPPREKKPKAERVPRAKKTGLPAGPFVWVGSDASLEVLAAGNPKYKMGNSGLAIVGVIKAAGENGVTAEGVATGLATVPRWVGVTSDRIGVALKQLFAAKLIAVKA